MATITLSFDNNINISLQAKPTTIASDTSNTDEGAWDVIYYVNTSGKIVALGECIAISTAAKTISVDVANSTVRPSTGDYVFFGKNTTAGTSGIIGYYAEVEMKNESTDKAELFAVSSEYFPSSK